VDGHQRTTGQQHLNCCFVFDLLLTQVAKLLVIPFVCGVEAVWMGRRFSNGTLLAIATVMAGVGIV
jgi:hypothetical protein